MESKLSKPRLLVSGVAAARSADDRETLLTDRLMQGLIARSPDWEHVVSWGEDDGRVGALGKLRTVDALVIMGGPDLEPAAYGGDEGYPGEQGHFPRSDRTQIALVRSAVKRGIPTLGICRGMQVMAAALGGSLVQDLDDPRHANPELLDDYRFATHRVKIASTSQLAAALGTAPLVHSAHHQAVSDPGSELSVVAHSEDGIVEAVEHKAAPVFGVQWHPEDPDAPVEPLSDLLGLLRKHVSLRNAA